MKRDGMDYRVFPNQQMSIRAEGDAKKIVGHAAVFNTPTEIGWWIEEIAPGAFANSITKDDVRALFNHDPNFVLGRNKSGTLALSEDDKGLVYEITPPDTQIARDLLVSIERGDISGSSFGWYTKKQEWSEEEKGGVTIIRRRILEAELFDVSPVTYPAYEETDVSLRSSIERAYNAYKESVKPEKVSDSVLIQARHAYRKRQLDIADKEV